VNIKEILYGVSKETGLNLIEEQCQPYLNEIGGIENALINLPMYRGISGISMRNQVVKVKINQSRQPRDSSMPLHTFANEWFVEHFGIPFRSVSCFTNGKRIYASAFSILKGGETVIVLPVGSYKYCWSTDFIDMTNQFGVFLQQKYGSETAQDIHKYPKKITKEMVDELLDSGGYRTTNLKEAIISDHEIMVASQSVLLIDTQWVKRNFQ